MHPEIPDNTCNLIGLIDQKEGLVFLALKSFDKLKYILYVGHVSLPVRAPKSVNILRKMAKQSFVEWKCELLSAWN